MDERAVEAKVERLDAQPRQQGVALDWPGRRGVPQQRTETTWIIQPDDVCSEDDVDMIVSQGRGHSRTRPDPPDARHAQVRDQGAVPEAPQQVLATALQRLDAATRHRLVQVVRHGPAQARIAHHDRLDRPPLDKRSQTAPCDFDFRQFRHRNGTDCGERVLIMWGSSSSSSASARTSTSCRS